MEQTQTSTEQLLPILERVCNQHNVTIGSCMEGNTLNLNKVLQRLEGKADDQFLNNLRQTLS